MPHTVDLLLDAKASLGEGSIWDADRGILYWVDILKGEVHLFDPIAGKDRTLSVGQYVGTVVPRKLGGLILALHHGIASFNPETGSLCILNSPESHLPNNRFNDGKCDPAGRFWAGTIGLSDAPRVAALYRMDTDLTVRRMLDDVTVSNGIVWSLDHSTMYYVDTPTRKVDAFDYNLASGQIGNRRTAIDVPADMGYPDGITIDAQGNLWVALWTGHGVACWDPASGKLLDRIEVPASKVTSCAFGGAGLTDLYITTARVGLDEAQLRAEPLAGGLFRAKPGVRGIPAFSFGG